MKRSVMIGACLLVSLAAGAQTEADWKRCEQLSADSLEHLVETVISPVWSDDGSSFYYDIKQGGENRYYLVDARTGKKQLLIKDNESFIRQHAALTGDTLKRDDFRIYGLQFKGNDRSHFYLNWKKKTLVYDVKRGVLSETQPLEQKNKRTGRPFGRGDSFQSADSAFTMMGKGYDLYVRNNRTGKVSRVTTDGAEGISYTYGTPIDSLTTRVRGFWQGHRYVCFMQDDRMVKEMALVDALSNPRPTYNIFKMPMPGDAGVRQYKIFWYDADCGNGRLLPIAKYPDQEVKLDFFRSDSALYFTRRSRTMDHIDLCRINLTDGTVTELISEECKPHINLTLFNYKILDKGKRFIWWSERTGYGNYYLYDANGRLLNRITRGDRMVAGNIVAVDSVRQEIIFAGYGNEPNTNPSYAYYYKAKLNGSGQTLLTPGHGQHELLLSPDNRYAVDKCSRMDMLPRWSVISIDRPQKHYKIEQSDDAALKQAGWKAPQLVTLKAADGKTDLYGLMYLPTTLDPTKKYPIISNVYPGPQDDLVPLPFTVDDNGNQSLAELGFVVINIPSRGSSPYRGRDFHCFGYGNLRDYPLADAKYVIEELAQRYPYIDLDRVGMYGHSGGGFETVAAMLTYPDFFKVGVAASGNHDNNIYIQWWGENFHGVKQATDPKTGKTTFSCHIPTNAELAGNLKGKLLLITGDVDRNVPPSSTCRLADALIKAGKRFDFFLLPGKDHGVQCPYYNNLIRYYFVENLLKPEAASRHIDIIHHK